MLDKNSSDLKNEIKKENLEIKKEKLEIKIENLNFSSTFSTKKNDLQNETAKKIEEEKNKKMHEQGTQDPCENFLSIVASTLAKLDYSIYKSSVENKDEAKNAQNKLKKLKTSYKRLIRRFVGVS